MPLPIVLAFTCMGIFGVVNFLGGQAARRDSAFSFVLWMNIITALLEVPLALKGVSNTNATHDVFVGLAAGVIGSIGLIGMFSAMRMAPFGVVTPITAIVSACIPPIYAIATGEPANPELVLGFVGGLVAIFLIAASRSENISVPKNAIVLACIAGLGFGFGVAIFSGASGDLPALTSLFMRISVTIVAFAGVTLSRQRLRLSKASINMALAAGALTVMSDLSIAIAISGENLPYLTPASLIASMNLVITILLGRLITKEHLRQRQCVGIAVSLASLTFVTIGASSL